MPDNKGGQAMGAVTVTTDANVCRVALNRPDKLNALDAATLAGLRTALEDLADRPQVRVLVLSGTGRAFSAGADLTARWTGGGDWSQRRHERGGWQRLLDLLEAVPQVTVAAVHGHCIGGAALLAVACDLRVAADDLEVRIPELAIGIPLTWGGIPRLAREVGLPVARDLVMTGRLMDATEALSAGFVQRVVPAAQLAQATDELVATLIAMPAGPLAMTRSMFSAISRERLGAAAWADADLLSWSTTEPESHAAAAAYAEQRALRRPQEDTSSRAVDS
jgi:enoyl-CoA hydratase/carnithine racemase